MFLIILSSHTLGTTGKKPWCCLEEMHICKAFPSNSIRYKPVNFHVTHSSFQVYIANSVIVSMFIIIPVLPLAHSHILHNDVQKQVK